MSVRFSRCVALGVALAVVAVSWPSSRAMPGDVSLLRIGTGGLLGVYYPVGKALAEGLARTVEARGLIAVAQTSGGSVANVRALSAGEIEVAMVQADVALWARQGQGPFAGESGVRGIVALASLYPERLQIVTRPEAGIASVKDLQGKSISLDEAGSGTLAAMRIVLRAHGLTEEDLRPAYLKPEFTVESLATGRLDGFCLMSGVPAQAVAEVGDLGIRLVPVDRTTAMAINTAHPHLVPGIIPDGVYPGVPETPTIEVNALLVVAETMAPDLAHDLTEALWAETTLAMLDAAHVQGRFVTLNSALHGLSIPLHSGARQYYRERGLIAEADPEP